MSGGVNGVESGHLQPRSHFFAQSRTSPRPDAGLVTRLSMAGGFPARSSSLPAQLLASFRQVMPPTVAAGLWSPPTVGQKL